MNELANSQMCIVMRNGIEIWVDKDRALRLQAVLKGLSVNKFIDFDDRSINTADILGVFNPQDMDLHTRRKNGEWQCDKGRWHSKGQMCDCSKGELVNWTAHRLNKKPGDNLTPVL
jgi:hypothetical protein